MVYLIHSILLVEGCYWDGCCCLIQNSMIDDKDKTYDLNFKDEVNYIQYIWLHMGLSYIVDSCTTYLSAAEK
jgi:hypothetical protein